MEITILSRSETAGLIKRVGLDLLLAHNRVISVNDFCHGKLFEQDNPRVLSLMFDDATPDFTWKDDVLFNGSMAEEVIDFLENHDGSDLIVHCYAGISRSAAIATFAARRLGYPEKQLKENRPIIHPNSHVLRTLESTYKFMNCA